MQKTCRRFLIQKLSYILIRPFAWLFFITRYRVKFEIPPEIRNLKGSYVLLGNHVNKWDPFIASIGLKRLVNFIASDFVFRKPFLAWLLGLLGAVPKVKFRSDMGSLRTLMDVRSCGGIIGIFPEGHTNWSGKTMEITPSTGKLLRLLRAPVVAVNIQGGYISEPRWHRGILAPGIVMKFSLLFTENEVRSLSIAQLNARLQIALEHNEWDYLREHPRELPAVDRARGIEHAVFICPDCGSIGSLRSRNNALRCTVCSGELEINRYGFPSEATFQNSFPDIALWDQWQQDRLISLISGQTGQAIFEDGPARFAYAPDGKTFSRFSRWGTLKFSGTSIVLHGEESIEYEIRTLSGIGVQNSEQLEFYVDNTLTTIEFKEDFVSPYKWLSALNHAQVFLGEEE